MHDGLAFGTIYPKYFVSLEEPYIYDLLKAYILPKGFNMDTGSKIIQLKGAVVARFGNDTLPPLRSHMHQSSHLHSVVESKKSKQSTLVTFDWTGINNPKQWEVRYKELRNIERIANSFTTHPLTFDRSTNSFHFPDELPTRIFTPPLIRSTSSSSYNNVRHQAKANYVSTSSLQPSFSRLHENEDRGQHSECLACHKILQRIQHHKNKDLPTLGMFSLPRTDPGMEIVHEGQRSYILGRNILETPFR